MKNFCPVRLVVFLALVLLGVTRDLAGQEVSAEVEAAEQRRVELIERIAPTVVCIFGRDGGGGGSGVLISRDGFALTNFHVTSGAGDFMKCGLNDGRLYDAVIVGIDPAGDVALIQLLGRDDFPVATLGDSNRLTVGDSAYALGNPFLLADDFKPTVTSGIISGLHRYQYPAGTFLEYTDCVQFDTSLNPGNSGGPLFNSAGEVIGINGRGSFEKRGRVNVGAGYAISSNQVKHFLDHLRSGRVVDHGTINATVSTSSDGAVRVATMLDDSSAFHSGLRSGDEIVSFAGRPIRSANQFLNVLGIYPAGWSLPMTYRRGSETADIFVRLTNSHRESELQKFSETKPDEENPQPGQPGGEDKPKPERPGQNPRPAPPQPKKQPIPEDLKALVEKRSGFANYRYNEIEQRRVMARMAGDISWAPSDAGVQISGRLDRGDKFRLTLSDAAAGLETNQGVALQPLGEGDALIDEPRGTGGMLAGLALFGKVLGGRQDSIGRFYYQGSEPLDGAGELVDVLHAEDRGGLLRLYVSRSGPALAGFDFYLSSNGQPCRVRCVGNAVELGDSKLPARWTVSFGTAEMFNMEWQSVRALRPAVPASD